MKKIGIFYGSSTGTCENLAGLIAEKLCVSNIDIHGADKISEELIKKYEVLILGTSTWGYGELQDDWYNAINVLKSSNLHGKTIALFGCGDSESYCDTFCNGMGIIYNELKDSGCIFVGTNVKAEDYSFSDSIAVINNMFVGLALDDVNESDKTTSRINGWVEDFKKNL